jgi:hypothetical protein
MHVRYVDAITKWGKKKWAGQEVALRGRRSNP